ncbi:MAG: lipoprotein-releasing ABC transporter permease subunit [Gammaproteobacteria bacterium]
MSNPVSLIAFRYLRARRKAHFASFVSVVSVLGIALGVAVLIIVTSVMNGFEKEVRGHVLGMTSHASVLYPGQAVPNWRAAASKINSHEAVSASSPFVRGGAMLSHKDQVHGAVIQGLDFDLEKDVSLIGTYVPDEYKLKLASDQPNILLGQQLLAKLDIKIGQRLVMIAPRFSANAGPLSPKYLTYTVAGSFKVGMHEFDSSMAIVSLREAQDIFELNGGVTGLRVKFVDPDLAPMAARTVAASLDPPAASINWTQYHRNFFQALKSQKRIMFVILSIIVAVAAFNIIAAMIMLVKEKHGDIAILRTLGMSRTGIMKIFVFQGTIIGFFGVAVGIIGGIIGTIYSGKVVMALENFFDIEFIKADVYYIDYLPAIIKIGDVLTVGLIAALISIVATIYPAWRASLTNPADALRYESA